MIETILLDGAKAIFVAPTRVFEPCTEAESDPRVAGKLDGFDEI